MFLTSEMSVSALLLDSSRRRYGAPSKLVEFVWMLNMDSPSTFDAMVASGSAGRSARYVCWKVMNAELIPSETAIV